MNEIKIQTWKQFEGLLVHGLKQFEIIHQDFTGQLCLHFNMGGLSDLDRLAMDGKTGKLEKSLKKRLT